MPTFSCYRCKKSIDYVPEYAGMEVACPHCGGSFVMPSPGGPPKVQAVVTPAREEIGRQRRFTEAKSLLDAFFDFRFEKYVTPLIVRATWIGVLVTAALWISLGLVLAVFALMPDSSSDRTASHNQPKTPASKQPGKTAAPRIEFRPPEFDFDPVRQSSPSGSSSVASWFDGKAIAVLAIITMVLVVFFFVLWMRVLLEAAVVIFNIAVSLASIDRKTKA